MQCSIYKSRKKSDTYLYVETQDNFERVPKTLLNMLGRLEFVMILDLEQRSKLAQTDPQQVISSLQQQGYFLQLPPKAYIRGST